MKITIKIFVVVMTLVIFAGCAGNNESVKAMSTSTNQNIFTEIAENEPPVPGYTTLRIYSSLKTHKAGIYSNKDIHGTQNYTLLVNIDGQVITLKGRMSEEKREARSQRDHEEGEGVRYQFTKNVRVKVGPHRLAVALPAEALVAESEVIVSDGENNFLVVEPIYSSVPGKQRSGTYGVTSFKEGIKSIRLVLNGKTI